MTIRIARLLAIASVWLATMASAGPPKRVTVTNFPATQNVNVVNSCAEASLVGFTSARLGGGQGVLGLAAACASEFSGSRVCTTQDLSGTSRVPLGLTGTAWIRPVLVFSTSYGALDEASGIHSGDPGELSCGHWSSVGGLGMAVDATGVLSLVSCSETRSVACCAP
jgi:hypothetical protein